MSGAFVTLGAFKFPKDTPNNIFQEIEKMLRHDIDNFSHVSMHPYEIHFQCDALPDEDHPITPIQNKALELLQKFHILEGFSIECTDFMATDQGYFFEYSPYPAISEDVDNEVIVQAKKHGIDLSEANKTCEFYQEHGNQFGAQEPIMVLDVCQGLAHYEKEPQQAHVLLFLIDHLTNIAYLEDESSWNEFAEIVANSDILGELQ